MYVFHKRAMAASVRRGHQISWIWCYRWLSHPVGAGNSTQVLCKPSPAVVFVIEPFGGIFSLWLGH